MSRAFVKETDGEAGDPLPERRVSDLPNLVTARGLGLIEQEVARLEAAFSAARSASDPAAVARASRDLRYWSARLASAQVVEPDPDEPAVAFGTRVTFEDGEGRRKSYRLVGEDEADPPAGRLSWYAPLAQALAGREVGDVVRGPRGELEILAVERRPEA